MTIFFTASFVLIFAALGCGGRSTPGPRPESRAADISPAPVLPAQPTEDKALQSPSPVAPVSSDVMSPGTAPMEASSSQPPSGAMVEPSTAPVPSSPTAPIEAPSRTIELTGGIDLNPTYLKLGILSGWAGDKKDTNKILDVRFYFDGDSKTGKLLDSVPADKVGRDDNLVGNHAFFFELPLQYRDNKPHQLHAYVNDSGVDVPLNSSFPMALTFYAPRGGAAEAIFNKTKLASNACNGCHGFTYGDRWSSLLHEGRDKTWTKDNNELINNLKTGHMGSRGPRNICGEINCPEVVNWWTAEFGP